MVNELTNVTFAGITTRSLTRIWWSRSILIIMPYSLSWWRCSKEINLTATGHPTQLSTPCTHFKEKQLWKAQIRECVAPSLWINTKKQFGNLAETSWLSRVCNTSGKCGYGLTSAISSFPIIGFSCAIWELQTTQDFCSAPTPESPLWSRGWRREIWTLTSWAPKWKVLQKTNVS